MITENNYKYPKAPTIEQIDDAIKKAGITESQFERYHGMYRGMISHARTGFRELPSRFWHLIFDSPKTYANKSSNKVHQNKPKSKQAHRKTESLSSLVS